MTAYHITFISESNALLTLSWLLATVNIMGETWSYHGEQMRSYEILTWITGIGESMEKIWTVKKFNMIIFTFMVIALVATY